MGSRALASQWVRRARVAPHELVWEVGAGTGTLTDELRKVAGRVVAVEQDPALARRLSRRFAAVDSVTVIEGNALLVPLPRAPYRAFGNIPFHITTGLLRRLLDDPRAPLLGADLVVASGVARKRTSGRPGRLLTLSWSPWWRLSASARIPARCFRPAPSVDGAMLTIRRRRPPLLQPRDRDAFVGLLERAFKSSSTPVGRSLRSELAPARFERISRELGISRDALPMDLEVHEWVSVFGCRRRTR